MNIEDSWKIPICWLIKSLKFMGHEIHLSQPQAGQCRLDVSMNCIKPLTLRWGIQCQWENRGMGMAGIYQTIEDIYAYIYYILYIYIYKYIYYYYIIILYYIICFIILYYIMLYYIILYIIYYIIYYILYYILYYIIL